MAVEYHKVLSALGITPTVIGRGQASAISFQQKTGVPVVLGGLAAFLRTAPEKPTAVIIAVNAEDLAQTAIALLDYGQPRVLLEKPGVFTTQELRRLQSCPRSSGLFIAYNRRFFASTQAVQAMLEEDGGPVSCMFEFTEWGHRIAMVIDRKDPTVMAHLFLANSSHVADMAFFLVGAPRTLQATVVGALPWHPSGSAFCGSGVTTRGVTFAYHANWKAPGRWWVEVMSEKRRFRMCPIEAVQVQNRGEVTWSDVPLASTKDKEFKPGLYDMVSGFLAAEPASDLCGFDEHAECFAFYQQIAGYTD